MAITRSIIKSILHVDHGVTVSVIKPILHVDHIECNKTHTKCRSQRM